MDAVTLGMSAFKILISSLPSSKQPPTDYDELRSIHKEHYEKIGSIYGYTER